MKKKGLQHNNLYSSHITTLPGTHNARENTDMQEIQQREQRDQRVRDQLAFKLKNNLYKSSA